MGKRLLGWITSYTWYLVISSPQPQPSAEEFHMAQGWRAGAVARGWMIPGMGEPLLGQRYHLRSCLTGLQSLHTVRSHQRDPGS